MWSKGRGIAPSRRIQPGIFGDGFNAERREGGVRQHLSVAMGAEAVDGREGAVGDRGGVDRLCHAGAPNDIQRRTGASVRHWFRADQHLKRRAEYAWQKGLLQDMSSHTSAFHHSILSQTGWLCEVTA